MKSQDPSPKTDPQGTAAWIRGQSKSVIEWIRRSVPRGLRLVIGLLLIVGGVLGFLPILGFWMIPLGIAIAALDVRPLSQALMKLMRWWK